MGGSHAFKTAWIEDVLSLMAPAFFLVSRRIEKKGEQPGFPFGFQRIGTLAFFLAAVALVRSAAFYCTKDCMHCYLGLTRRSDRGNILVTRSGWAG